MTVSKILSGKVKNPGIVCHALERSLEFFVSKSEGDSPVPAEVPDLVKHKWDSLSGDQKHVVMGVMRTASERAARKARLARIEQASRAQ